MEHPTHGQRTIALVLASERYGGWRVSHGGAANVLRRAGRGYEVVHQFQVADGAPVYALVRPSPSAPRS